MANQLEMADQDFCSLRRAHKEAIQPLFDEEVSG